VVYRATDEQLGRQVALKVLRDSTFPHARERFLREVRMIAGLQHPNVVLLYGAGEDSGVAWAAMELMPHSLSQELQQSGRFSAEALRAVTRDVCHGLDAVWKRGIVHRDIKPSNLLRGSSGVVKVADFGLAKDLALELNLTAADVVLGTPWYVSPEQAAGKAVGCASDLYSLGATLYHLAAGRPPFESSNALDVIVRHAIEPVPPLPADVPESIARLIFKLLEKDPARRPADYLAVLAMLEGDAATDEPDVPMMTASNDPAASDGMSASLLGAARAAVEMGRSERAKTLLAPIIEKRSAGWVRAAFLLASALEDSARFAEAGQLLEQVTAETSNADDRALALWSLGRLAERESRGALARAVAIYQRIGDVSSTRFPKTLLDARIARLERRQQGERSSTGSDPRPS
jgi:serine/threonine protein kinase